MLVSPVFGGQFLFLFLFPISSQKGELFWRHTVVLHQIEYWVLYLVHNRYIFGVAGEKI